MSSLRLFRSTPRCFAPAFGRSLHHSSHITRRLPQLLHRYRASLVPQKPCITQTKRLFSAVSARQEAEAQKDSNSEERWANTPAYEMTFTCTQCKSRSTHKLSKQGYHHGTVIVTCPGCKNRHLISDHLKIFSDTRVSLEDIMKDKGQLVKRGTLGADGDVEFWDDGTETMRETKSSDETKSLA